MADRTLKGCAKTQICKLFSEHLNYCHPIQNSSGYWYRLKLPSSSAESCLGLSRNHHRIWWHGLLSWELQEYWFKYWTTMMHKAPLSAYLCNNIEVQGMVSIQPSVLKAPQEVKDILWYLRSVTPSKVLQSSEQRGQQMIKASVCLAIQVCQAQS